VSAAYHAKKLAQQGFRGSPMNNEMWETFLSIVPQGGFYEEKQKIP
jgi:hypothetical protein